VVGSAGPVGPAMRARGGGGGGPARSKVLYGSHTVLWRATAPSQALLASPARLPALASTPSIALREVVEE
jgi:hypothetical protein